MRTTLDQNHPAPRVAALSVRSPTVETARSPVVTCDSSYSAIRSFCIGNSRKFQAVQPPPVRALRARHGIHSHRAHTKITLGPAAALRRRITQARRDEPLILQAVERGAERSRRRVAIGTGVDLFLDGDAVSAVVQAQNGQQYHLFEFA